MARKRMSLEELRTATIERMQRRMYITPNQNFRHDQGLFLAGVEYDVPDQLGKYFVNVGWATSDGYEMENSADGMIPPEKFRVDSKNRVSIVPTGQNLHSRGPSPDLEIQDMTQDQKPAF